jgi:sigma-B regulation protein RsbU (phosphoserine phosphatase)
MFVTLLYGVLEFKSGSFNFARAGHLVPLVMTDKGQAVNVPNTLGQPLGLFDDPVMDEQSVVIPDGGLAFIFSDGLSEAADESGVEFGETGLRKAVGKIQQEPAQTICEDLWQSVNKHYGGHPQQDDFTVITLKRTSA